MKKVNILNTSIDNISKKELLEKLTKHGGILVTPNADHLMKLQKDRAFYYIYKLCNYRVCDSQIVFYAAKFLGNPLKEKISGSDFLADFYYFNANNKETKIFLLGAAEGVAKKAQEIINQKVGREIVVGSHSPSFGFEKNEIECQKIVDLIEKSGATVLAIGVGCPKQEKWIFKYKDQLKNIKIFLAIGTTIDFEAGSKPESRQWLSKLGLEWFYRLLCEPRRLWKRYLVDALPFFWLLVQQKLNLYQDPFAVRAVELRPLNKFHTWVKLISQALNKWT